MRVSSPRWRTLAVTTLLVLVVCYAALLRLDALFKSYGPYDQPRWLAAMQPAVGAAASTLTPNWPWRRDPTPYVGGDPINYLKFARGMRNFYAAHVREPMFPAVTRIGLMFTGDEDVGVSVTSIAFGLLTLVATYALGALVASPMVGLAAAAMLGIDQTAVYLGDRRLARRAVRFLRRLMHVGMDTVRPPPTRANAVLAGALSGGACLTRITTIALIAPAVVWLLATRGATHSSGVGASPSASWRCSSRRFSSTAPSRPATRSTPSTTTPISISNAKARVDDVRPISAVRYSLCANSRRARLRPQTMPCAGSLCIRSATSGSGSIDGIRALEWRWPVSR